MTVRDLYVKRPMRRIFIAALCTICISLMAAACSSTPCPSGGCTELDNQSNGVKETAMDTPLDKEAEKVGSIQFDGAQVSATVVSTGCTRAEDFLIENQVRDGSCYVEVVRAKPDYCRRAPFGVEIALDWQPSTECDNLPIVFVNPVDEMLTQSEGSTISRQMKKP